MRRAQVRSSLERNGLRVLVALTIAFIFTPSLYLLIISFDPSLLPGIPAWNEISLKWYRELFQQWRLPGALKQAALDASLTAVFTGVLALFAGLTYRELKNKAYFLALLIFPIFIPGVVMGLSLSVFFKLLHLRPSLWTVVLSHTLYALPFATIVILVSFSSLKESLIEASHDLGAGKFKTFKDVIFPLTRNGILGAALFGFLLALNEFIRAYMVSGWQETLSIYMFGQMKSGADPSIYALAGLILSISILLILLALLYYAFIRKRSAITEG